MEARLDTHDDGCPALDRDAIAAVNGTSVSVSDSGLDGDGTCQPAQFAAPWSSVAQFVIADPSATWTFDFAFPPAQFAVSPEPLAPGMSTITWVGGMPIIKACVTVFGPGPYDMTELCTDAPPQTNENVGVLADPRNELELTYLTGNTATFSAGIAVEGVQTFARDSKQCRGPLWCALDASTNGLLD